MKKLSLLALILLIATSCIDKVNYSKKMKELVLNCETFKDFKVPVVENCITVMTLNGDTVAITNKPMTIKVPKNTLMATTRSSENDNLLISYVNKNDIKYEELEKRTYGAYWQAVMFEDSKNGDYDYNDLVIHISSVIETPWNTNKALQTIRLQPIALGSSKNIGLGCVLSDYSEHIISNNVRADLFGGNQGFINTLDEKEPIRFKLEPTQILKYEFPYDENKTYWVAWFIEVDGTRQYAVSGDFEYANYNNVISKDLLPYGLVIANDNGTFKYPKETISIFDTYKSFKDWVYNSNANIGKSEKENVYKYCFDKSINGKNKIWDYQDLK